MSKFSPAAKRPEIWLKRLFFGRRFYSFSEILESDQKLAIFFASGGKCLKNSFFSKSGQEVLFFFRNFGICQNVAIFFASGGKLAKKVKILYQEFRGGYS